MPRTKYPWLEDPTIDSREKLLEKIPDASPKLIGALDQYLKEQGEPELPPKSKEELAREALIKLAETRKLTGAERRKLANLNRRLRLKEKRELRRGRSSKRRSRR